MRGKRPKSLSPALERPLPTNAKAKELCTPRSAQYVDRMPRLHSTGSYPARASDVPKAGASPLSGPPACRPKTRAMSPSRYAGRWKNQRFGAPVLLAPKNPSRRLQSTPELRRGCCPLEFRQVLPSPHPPVRFYSRPISKPTSCVKVIRARALPTGGSVDHGGAQVGSMRRSAGEREQGIESR